jgi:hypothetical protein
VKEHFPVRGSRGRQDVIEYAIVCEGLVSAAEIRDPIAVDGELPSGTEMENVAAENVGAALVSMMEIVTGQYG